MLVIFESRTQAPPLESEVIKTPQDIIAELISRREAIQIAMIQTLSVVNCSPSEQSSCYDLSVEIERINSIIQSLASKAEPVPTVVIRGTEASKYATTPTVHEGLTLSREDLPRLQLVGKTYDQFKGRQVLKNIDDYLKTFEEVIMSARQEVKTNWRRYLPIALADELKAWMRKDLLVCDSWDEAKKVLEKKFGKYQMRVLATKELISLTMYHDENIYDFDNRFIRMVEDSEYQVSDRIMADLYFLALPNNWQANVMTVVNSKKLKDVPWTLKRR
ncbi:hypothetical protein INT47_003813 [Mucor saturninus]|uniref:Retrotransposon gag domain-containing protein n=1 Tax=Mucor saturninus TaxID=64648 RepID=A0A8H7R879_9FUNG|nr:hypothetical protein INT47_003813 [Mucor saturninus]